MKLAVATRVKWLNQLIRKKNNVFIVNLQHNGHVFVGIEGEGSEITIRSCIQNVAADCWVQEN